MDVIVTGRQGGKTTQLIRRAAEQFAYIVCPDRTQAGRIARKARAMSLDIPQPITFDDFIQRRWHGRGIRAFMLDNLDACIQSMARGVPVTAVTLTDDSPVT